MKFTVQRHRLTKRLRPNLRAVEHSLPPQLPPFYHYITKGLFPFTQYIISGYQEGIIRQTKNQKIQYEKAEQESEPDNLKALDPDGFSSEFYQICKETTPIQNIEAVGILPNSFQEASITLRRRPDKSITRKQTTDQYIS